MPLSLKIRVKEGWKQKDNQRFGDCLEVHFIDTKTDKTIFIYAPKLEDKHFFEEMFAKLEHYDSLHKQIYTLVKSIDGDIVFSGGECKRLQNETK